MTVARSRVLLAAAPILSRRAAVRRAGREPLWLVVREAAPSQSFCFHLVPHRRPKGWLKNLRATA